VQGTLEVAQICNLLLLTCLLCTMHGGVVVTDTRKGGGILTLSAETGLLDTEHGTHFS
jgi:hypothetical protein